MKQYEQLEITRLKRNVIKLKADRDILKKLLAATAAQPAQPQR